MSFQVDTALINTYRSNIEIQFQQQMSKLRSAVREESQAAEFDFYDRIGPVEAEEVTTRHGDTPLISTPHDRRRVGLRDFDWADLIDRKDKIRMLADPTSSYTQNAVMALYRKMDSVIITAAFDTAYTGKAGATSVTFPSASELAVDYVESGAAANSNLTIGKLRKARLMFDLAEAANGEANLTWVGSPYQKQSLLRTTEVTSSDYAAVKALVHGEVNTFMGFNFIWSNLLPVASSIRSNLVFERQGLLLAMGQGIQVDVGPRRDKRNTVQVYVCGTWGASRMWEDKVIRCKCDETK